MYFNPADGMKPAPLTRSPFHALVVPRPIGWISSIDAQGRVNLAPFSFFNAVCADPPCVMFCPSGPHVEGGPLDSLKNVQEVPEFVVNIADASLQDQVVLSSKEAPRAVNEFELTGLTEAPSVAVKPPRVGEAKAALECKVIAIHTLPTGANDKLNAMVVGQVVGIYIDDSVIVNGRVDIALLRPLSRLGYMDYTIVESAFELERPD